ncbi:unnamed protein product [Adineta steineri]|uniref:Bulb-type lectin domain-containing protein n=1 Tax=Adineta steineri TaxID=433720 RepID=A0A813PC33_9BILA|nr:unnamed protein product [Adineta steineri]
MPCQISAAPLESHSTGFCGYNDQSSNGFHAIQSKWSKSRLTWSILSYPSTYQISESNTKQILREAFKAWTDHIPIEIEEVCSTCNADIVIKFVSRAHDNCNPFDGKGGVLAHAYLPEVGQIHFDWSETWTESFDGSDTNLFLVAVHEIGHALGLLHSENKESIMYATYPFASRSKNLPSTDIASIQQLYGTRSKSGESDRRAVWASDTHGHGSGPYHLVLQNDGNLVLYDGKNDAKWASGTHGRYDVTHLRLQDDGNLVIYISRDEIWHKAIWATRTNE